METPQRIDEDIAGNDPVRMVNALVESLDLESFRKLYKECGRSPYHPRMMLKVILYAYMNNIRETGLHYHQPFPQPGEEENQRSVHPGRTSALFQGLHQPERGIQRRDKD